MAVGDVMASQGQLTRFDRDNRLMIMSLGGSRAVGFKIEEPNEDTNYERLVIEFENGRNLIINARWDFGRSTWLQIDVVNSELPLPS